MDLMMKAGYWVGIAVVFLAMALFGIVTGAGLVLLTKVAA